MTKFNEFRKNNYSKNPKKIRFLIQEKKIGKANMEKIINVKLKKKCIKDNG